MGIGKHTKTKRARKKAKPRTKRAAQKCGRPKKKGRWRGEKQKGSIGGGAGRIYS